MNARKGDREEFYFEQVRLANNRFRADHVNDGVIVDAVCHFGKVEP